MRFRLILSVALIAFLAAIVGVGVGRWLLPDHRTTSPELHEVLHHQLTLTPNQEVRIDALERQFLARRTALELDVRAANARLAEAIEAEHGNGPRVAAAVDASHRAMGELQKATLAHIFAMREVLDPAQAAKFDRAVAKALTSDTR